MNELVTRSLAQPDPEESGDEKETPGMEPGMVEEEEKEKQPGGEGEEW
ncbi:hypothetical protein HYW30_01035 [Candidatus Azambacteria bacterium]|nr:hypothetical protein [Candidatus Azambacteria bacterium]MBI2587873.1 hypothetical protein [Candidatus Azambacteria bacterium]